MSVGGIDFGNESCTVALARSGGIDVVINEASNRSTPSVVSYDEKQRWVGERAADNAVRNFRNTVVDIKRLLGKFFDDDELRDDLQRIAFRVQPGEDGFAQAVVNYGREVHSFMPEAILGTLFSALKTSSSSFNDARVVDFVVSVPSYFDDVRRRALENAMRVGGLNCLGMINETTAAALDYGIFRSMELPDPDKAPENVMFVDYGHSALSVSVASFVKGQVNVLAHSWDTAVGTRALDWLLLDFFAEQFLQKYKIDLRESKKAVLRLLKACEKTKKVLSANAEATVSVECLYEELDFFSRITREQFEEMCGAHMDRITETLIRCMQESGIEKKDLSAVEVIGGGSRIPAFKRLISDHLDLPLRTRLNASESIARGCAIQAAILSPAFRVRDFSVKDVTSFPVSIRWDGREKDYDVFPQRNGFPSSKKLTLNVKKDFSVSAFYPDSSRGLHSSGTPMDVGQFVVTGVPPRDGTVKVVARMTSHGVFNIPLAEFVELVEVEERVPKKIDTDSKTPAPREKPSEMKPSASVEAVEDRSASPVPQVPESATAPMEVDGQTDEPAACTEEGQPQDAPMDAAEPEPEPEYEIRIKKKKVVTTLKVDARVHSINATTLQHLFEDEGKMQAEDRLVVETAEKRNALESYVYEMRGKMGDQLAPYSEERVRTDFVQQLDDAEDWLYGDGEDCKKSVYVRKLDELRAIGDPIVARFEEDMNRPMIISRFVSDLETLRERATAQDESLSHIPAEERDGVVAKCDEALAWVHSKVSQQNVLPKHADVAVKCSEVDKKRIDVLAEGNAVLNKPKPAPAKKDESAKTEEAKGAEEGEAGDAPMDVDPAPDVPDQPDDAASPMDLD